MRLALCVILSIAILVSAPALAQAAPFYKDKAVGIELSKSCKTASKCPKPSDLVQFDNSDPRFFGKFDEKGNRIMSPRTDSFEWLKIEKNYIILYDPPPKTRMYIPIITIAPSLPAFFTQEQMKKVEVDNGPYKAKETVRQISHTRYVNDSCTEAIITAENWRTVLPDTIEFMQYGCDPTHTHVETVTKDIQPITEHKLPTSYKYKLDKMYDQVKKKCLKTYGKCKPLNPNISDEDQTLEQAYNGTNSDTKTNRKSAWFYEKVLAFDAVTASINKTR